MPYITVFRTASAVLFASKDDVDALTMASTPCTSNVLCTLMNRCVLPAYERRRHIRIAVVQWCQLHMVEAGFLSCYRPRKEREREREREREKGGVMVVPRPSKTCTHTHI